MWKRRRRGPGTSPAGVRPIPVAADGALAQATASVIVEVKVPPVRLARPLPGRGRPAGIAPDAGLDAADTLTAERLDAVLRALGAGTETPTVLPGACAVVATVTPAQLRLLAAMPEVEVIRRNRKHGGAAG